MVELGPPDRRARLAVWGHPQHKLLVIEIDDPSGILSPVRLELTEWRQTMRLAATPEKVSACEVHARPARPHLVNTGMEDFFGPQEDPLEGRGTAVVVGAKGAAVQNTSVDGGKPRVWLRGEFAGAIKRSA